MTALPQRPLPLVTPWQAIGAVLTAAALRDLPKVKASLGHSDLPEIEFRHVMDMLAWQTFALIDVSSVSLAGDEDGTDTVLRATIPAGAVGAAEETRIVVRYPTPVDVDEDPRAGQDSPEEQHLAAMRQQRYAREAGR